MDWENIHIVMIYDVNIIAPLYWFGDVRFELLMSSYNLNMTRLVLGKLKLKYIINILRKKHECLRIHPRSTPRLCMTQVRLNYLNTILLLIHMLFFQLTYGFYNILKCFTVNTIYSSQP